MNGLTSVMICLSLWFALGACNSSSTGEELAKRPEGLLLYPGAEITQPLRIYNATDFDPVSGATKLFVTTDSPEQVFAFYTEELRARGWSGPTKHPNPIILPQYSWQKGKLGFLLVQIDEKDSAPEFTRPGMFLFSQTLGQGRK